MCTAIIQWRSDNRFDLSLKYCQKPEPPRVFDLEHIGTAMMDKVEARQRAQAKYVHHNCAKRFGCSLKMIEQEAAPPKEDGPTFFEQALRHNKP